MLKKIKEKLPLAATRFIGMSLLLILGFDFFFRLVFLFRYSAEWPVNIGQKLLPAFLVGLRFDLAVSCLLNGALFLFVLLPTGLLKNPRIWKGILVLSVMLNLPQWILNGADLIYYGYSRKRLSHELFSVGGELMNFKPGDILPWWWAGMLILAALFFFIWGMRSIVRDMPQKMENEKSPLFFRFVWIACMSALLFLCIRGGWQERPLRPAMAYVTGDYFLGSLANNSAYNVISAAGNADGGSISWMSAEAAQAQIEKMLRNDFDSPLDRKDYPLMRKATFEGDEKHFNVVLIILESMNAELLSCINSERKPSLTPFLDSLAHSGILYTKFFANGTRSIESLPGILNSVPDIFIRPLIGSAQEINRVRGIGHILAERGYHTSFFCGGENGTMGFDAYSHLSGFNNYFGKNEFPGSGPGLSSHWGLHDHPWLQWMAEKQNEFPKPFLSAWFSISNHYPFETPADCPDYIRKMNISAKEKTVMYTDWALSAYFRKIASYPWFSQTLFVITADHCFFGENNPNYTLPDNFHVPLILYGPGMEARTDSSSGSHLCILPTLIDVLRLDTWHSSAGVSLFSKNAQPFAIGNMVGLISYTKGNYSFTTNFESESPSYRFQNGKWGVWPDAVNSPEGQMLQQELRAYYQIMHNARLQNRIDGDVPDAPATLR